MMMNMMNNQIKMMMKKFNNINKIKKIKFKYKIKYKIYIIINKLKIVNIKIL